MPQSGSPHDASREGIAHRFDEQVVQISVLDQIARILG